MKEVIPDVSKHLNGQCVAGSMFAWTILIIWYLIIGASTQL
jgi:hypothetical protein